MQTTRNKTLTRVLSLIVLMLLAGVLSVNIVMAQTDPPPEAPIPGVDGVLLLG